MAGRSTIRGPDIAVQDPTGGNQSKSLPWNNLNQIAITFDEDPVDPAATAQMILSGGAGDPSPLDGLVEGTPVWDASLHALVWTLSGPIGKDRLRINLNDNLADAAGNKLDGEWVDREQHQFRHRRAGGRVPVRI